MFPTRLLFSALLGAALAADLNSPFPTDNSEQVEVGSNEANGGIDNVADRSSTLPPSIVNPGLVEAISENDDTEEQSDGSNSIWKGVPSARESPVNVMESANEADINDQDQMDDDDTTRPIPSNSCDPWDELGLPGKPIGSSENECFASDGTELEECIYVHEVAHLFSDLRAKMNASSGDSVTARIVSRQRELQILEIVSQIADVFDLANFELFMSRLASDMPISVRCDIVDVFAQHLTQAENADSVSLLGRFIDIIKDYPVDLGKVSAGHYLDSLKQLTNKLKSPSAKLSNYLSEEQKRVEGYIIMAHKEMHKCLRSGNFEGALVALNQYPFLKLNYDSIKDLMKFTSYSTSRFEFVKKALEDGLLDPNLTSPKSGHVLFKLVSNERNCNDIVMAFLSDKRCKRDGRNKRGFSLAQVAGQNSALCRTEKQALIAVLQSNMHSIEELYSYLHVIMK